MWDRYRKTAPTTQCFIVICCALMYCITKSPLRTILIAFIAMEIGAVFGAFWTERLMKKLERENKKASKK